MRLSNFLLITLITYSEAGMSSAIASKDKLVIGIAQFPSTLHPNIDTVAAKSYIHAMTARHFTVFDKDWKLICMLFIKLPTIENGLAKKNTQWKKNFLLPIPFTQKRVGVMELPYHPKMFCWYGRLANTQNRVLEIWGYTAEFTKLMLKL